MASLAAEATLVLLGYSVKRLNIALLLHEFVNTVLPHVEVHPFSQFDRGLDVVSELILRGYISSDLGPGPAAGHI
jgi:hypothetical protein